jgi:hypothetical protein
MRGSTQKAIAWCLLEHGTLSYEQLHALVDNTLAGLRRSVFTLLHSEVLAALPGGTCAQGSKRKRKVYGLTRKGLDLAVELQASDVEGLRSPTDPLYAEPEAEQQAALQLSPVTSPTISSTTENPHATQHPV